MRLRDTHTFDARCERKHKQYYAHACEALCGEGLPSDVQRVHQHLARTGRLVLLAEEVDERRERVRELVVVLVPS